MEINATVQKAMDSFDSIKKIVEQLEGCGYENMHSVLVNNVAFMKLKQIAESSDSIGITAEMDIVGQLLEDARNVALPEGKTVDLSVEAVCWALKFMKENPSLGISEALVFGLAEWDK